MKYIPNGEMCLACIHLHRRECCKLKFETMHPIEEWVDKDGTVYKIVACTDRRKK